MGDLSKKTALYGLILCVAVMASYIESLIPVDLMIPGVKAGLANCIILFVLYRYGFSAAVMISILRSLIMAFLFTSPSVLIYSLSGAAVSLLLMGVIKRSGLFSVYGISAIGGVSHNVTQLLIAYFVLFTDMSILRLVTFYLPALIISGIAAGIFNALIADVLIKRIPGSNFIKRS